MSQTIVLALPIHLLIPTECHTNVLILQSVDLVNNSICTPGNTFDSILQSNPECSMVLCPCFQDLVQYLYTSFFGSVEISSISVVVPHNTLKPREPQQKDSALML